MAIMQLSTSFLGNQHRAQRGVSTFSAGGATSTATRQVTAIAKKKGVRLIVTLECTEARALGKPPSRYTTQKSKRNTPDRLELMKYNRFLRRHTLHREIK